MLFFTLAQEGAGILDPGLAMGTGGFTTLFVMRLNLNGSLDNSFGNNGKVNTFFGGFSRGYHIAFQADGKILVSALSTNDITLRIFDMES